MPLGGDGFHSPQAAYVVSSFAVSGAVGGGNAILTVNMDPRFCALVNFVTVQIQQVASATVDVRMRVSGNQNPTFVDSGPVVAIDADVSAITIARTWFPPPVILGGGGEAASIEMRTINVDADIYLLEAYIYLFDIRARELTPMGPLLWARGST